jgi:hypothetical protein
MTSFCLAVFTRKYNTVNLHALYVLNVHHTKKGKRPILSSAPHFEFVTLFRRRNRSAPFCSPSINALLCLPLSAFVLDRRCSFNIRTLPFYDLCGLLASNSILDTGGGLGVSPPSFYDLCRLSASNSILYGSGGFSVCAFSFHDFY